MSWPRIPNSKVDASNSEDIKATITNFQTSSNQLRHISDSLHLSVRIPDFLPSSTSFHLASSFARTKNPKLANETSQPLHYPLNPPPSHSTPPSTPQPHARTFPETTHPLLPSIPSKSPALHFPHRLVSHLPSFP